MGRYRDGRVSAVFGTHTHVQPADEQILPCSTAYITDLGMTGPTNGVLGVSYDIIISKFLTHMPHRFKVADGECRAHGILLDIDESTGKARSIKRIVF
jgi:calcineurin-like phosphoesterase